MAFNTYTVIGIVLLLAGLVITWMSMHITKIFKIKKEKAANVSFIIKIAGLIIAVAGFLFAMEFIKLG